MNKGSVSATALAKMTFCEVNLLRKAKLTSRDKKRIARGVDEHNKFEARMTGSGVSYVPSAALTSVKDADMSIPSPLNPLSVSKAVVSYGQRTAQNNTQGLYGADVSEKDTRTKSNWELATFLRLAFAVLTMLGIVAAYMYDKI